MFWLEVKLVKVYNIHYKLHCIFLQGKTSEWIQITIKLAFETIIQNLNICWFRIFETDNTLNSKKVLHFVFLVPTI